MKMIYLRQALLAAATVFYSGVLSATATQGTSDEVTPEVQRLYAEARQERQRGNVDIAISKYKEMIRLAPHLGAAYNNLGMLYFDKHDYKQASLVLKRGLELSPGMSTTEAMLGMSYFQLGQPAKAQPLLESALKANPKDDQVEMVLSQILIANHDLAAASTHLNAYLARNPRDQQAWYTLGKAYLQLSEDSLKRINEIDPNSVVAHEIAGEIDQSMHNYDLALVEYKKAVDMGPNMPGTHMHMADAYWNLSKWKSAEEEFRAELQNDPNSCIARWKLANSMLEANETPDEAFAELNQSVERCPALMQAHVDRARALIRLGRHGEALPDLLMAEKESPNEPSIHFLLGAVYRAQGNKVEAQKETQTYSELQRQAMANVAAQADQSSAIKSAAK